MAACIVEACWHCGSRRLLQGRLPGSGFLPDHVESGHWWPVSSVVIPVKPLSFICLDCGVLCSAVDRDVARETVRKWGDGNVVQRLDLIEKKAPADPDWLD